MSHVKQFVHGQKIGRQFAGYTHRCSARKLGDKWHLDDSAVRQGFAEQKAERVVVTIAGKKQWLSRAVDQDEFVLDVLVHGRRNTKAVKRLMKKILKAQGHLPRVMITDKLRSYDAAKHDIMPGVEHRSHKGLNNRAENSYQPLRRQERIKKRFKSARHLQQFVPIQNPIADLFNIPRHEITSSHYRELRTTSMKVWHDIAGLQTV